MGAWNIKLSSNDTFKDIYQRFFDLYNQGGNPADISKQIQEEFAEMFTDQDDRSSSLFALALAQWETKSLDSHIFKQVREIIKARDHFEVGKALNDKTIEKQKKELNKFLSQISTERKKPKYRIRPKFEYNANHLLTLPAPDAQKTFEIIESYVNGEYKDTSSAITWAGGGSSVFYFYAKGKFVTARWIDSHTLEIRHDKTIEFTKKEENFYFCGDQGIIKYIAE
jgi:hypothetical protein